MIQNKNNYILSSRSGEMCFYPPKLNIFTYIRCPMFDLPFGFKRGKNLSPGDPGFESRDLAVAQD